MQNPCSREPNVEQGNIIKGNMGAMSYLTITYRHSALYNVLFTPISINTACYHIFALCACGAFSFSPQSHFNERKNENVGVRCLAQGHFHM